MSQTDTGTALLTIPEVAAELRVTRSTVYRYIHEGLLPTTPIGPKRLTRITRSALNAYIESCSNAGAA